MKWIICLILFSPTLANARAYAGNDPTGGVNNFGFILFLALMTVAIWWWKNKD